MNGVLTYPPEYVPGKKYPLVLHIHGGPSAASQETFPTGARIRAARGWLVLSPTIAAATMKGTRVWKAAVAGAPVAGLVDRYTLSDNNIQRATGYGPSPFVGDNMKSYAVQSPINYAWRIKTPTLIMSDVGDWRVRRQGAGSTIRLRLGSGWPVTVSSAA